MMDRRNMEMLLKYKKQILIALCILLFFVVLLECDIFDEINYENDAELSACNFVEAMFDADAKTCADFMCDDLIEISNYETKKLFINALEKQLESAKDEHIEKYGKRWKYEVSVIDSFEYEAFYDCDEDLVKVVLKVEHKGSGLFNKKEGEEEIELIMVERNGKWLVYDL